MGRTGEMILGILVAALLVLFIGGIGEALEVSGAETVTERGLGALFMGVLGIVGGAIVDKNNKVAGALMLISAVVGLILVSGFWVLSFILLLVGGILALKNTS